MPEWWEDFFSGLWQEVQLGVSTEQDNGAAADKIVQAIQLQPGSRVLDVPCGDGRIAIELAARGHDVTGVDITERFLMEARRKSDERGVSARWEHGDMRELPYTEEFDAVINFWGSFGYFDEKENERFATAVWHSLHRGGRFLIDVASPETIFPNFREHFWFGVEDSLVLSRNRYDHETGRIEADWTMVAPDGRREVRHSSIRLYTYRELAGLLRAAGFRHIQGLNADNLQPFALAASRLIVVATKE